MDKHKIKQLANQSGTPC